MQFFPYSLRSSTFKTSVVGLDWGMSNTETESNIFGLSQNDGEHATYRFYKGY